MGITHYGTVDVIDGLTVSGVEAINSSGEAIAAAPGVVTDAMLATANVGLVVRTAIATATGATTGTLTAGSQFVTVTSASANNIVILPAPVSGTKITLLVTANGCELRSSSPTTIGINGGTGADAESAIGANVVVHMTCTSATTWTGFQQAADGTLTLVEVAA